MWPNPQKAADLVTFIEEILNGKFHFLCSAMEVTQEINLTLKILYSEFWTVLDNFGQSESWEHMKEIFHRIYS